MAPLSGACFPFSVSFALFVHSDLSPHPWMSVAVSSSTSSTQIYLPPGWHKQREIALSFPRDSFQTCQVDDWLDSMGKPTERFDSDFVEPVLLLSA